MDRDSCVRHINDDDDDDDDGDGDGDKEYLDLRNVHKSIRKICYTSL